jgi:hypothetical protein
MKIKRIATAAMGIGLLFSAWVYFDEPKLGRNRQMAKALNLTGGAPNGEGSRTNRALQGEGGVHARYISGKLRVIVPFDVVLSK